MMDRHGLHISSPERPGPLGRIGRILFGGLVGWYMVRFVSGWITAIQQGRLSQDQVVYTPVVQKGNLAFYALTILSVYWVPLGNRRQRFIGAGILFSMVIGLDYLLVGDWWALPFAVVASLIIVITFAYAGAFAHILAGLIANPGCEQTALSNWLRASQPDHKPKVETCILWDPVDHVEKRLWQCLRR